MLNCFDSDDEEEYDQEERVNSTSFRPNTYYIHHISLPLKLDVIMYYSIRRTQHGTYISHWTDGTKEEKREINRRRARESTLENK